MKKIIALLLAVLSIFSFSSCSQKDSGSSDTEKFRIVTSFYPVYVTTLNLVEGAQNVELTNLTKTEYGCLHDYIMTTDDIKKLTGADLFIVSGMNMEAFVGKVSLGVPGLTLLECGEDVPYKIGEYEEANPHYWLNIENTIAQCEKIRKNLCTLDPANAEVYSRNAEEYTKKLYELKAEAEKRCQSLDRKEIAVFYKSFDYFANEFGIKVNHLLDEHEGSAPSAKEVAEIVTEIRRSGIDTLFTEKGTSEDSSIRTIVKETGCKVVELDMVMSGKADENTKDAYTEAIRYNLDVLEQYLGIKQ